MTVAADSASYPILGAAQAAGVDYGLALRWAWLSRLWWAAASDDERDDWIKAMAAVVREIDAAHGQPARDRLARGLSRAFDDGRIHAPEMDATFSPPTPHRRRHHDGDRA